MASGSDYKIRKLLGSGHFGKVYLANNGGKSFAIKKVVNTERNTAHQEIKILKQVDHKYIIKYYDHFMEGKILCIVLEYADVGTMEKAVKQGGIRHEEWAVWRMTGQLSSALAYLHSRNPQILHHDLKPDNILGVTNKETGGVLWKLGDFGLHRLLGEEGEDPFYFYAHTCCGTPNYMAPEVCYLFRQLKICAQVWTNVCRYSFPADIWSLGCILMFRCSRGNHLFQFRREDVRGDPIFALCTF